MLCSWEYYSDMMMMCLQDMVVEFARMNKQELLLETEKTVSLEEGMSMYGLGGGGGGGGGWDIRYSMVSCSVLFFL